ncbi:MAG: hypothetical protein IPO81_28675 [Kouleothrix sp.]|nr:hypothetical protein [Kouleothrix sp.]
MREATEKTEEQESRPGAAGEEAECPQCEGTMRLWANYYRCSNCGYKESCCF